MKKRVSKLCFLIIRGLIWLFYPRITIEGLEKLPKEPCIIVGNHSQMNGPICGELYFPGKRKIWCAWQMMYRKEVPAYAFADFWSKKPRWTHWFYKMLSHIIAPISVCVFNNAYTIPVYHDTRVMITFKKTIKELEDGGNVIVFPECYEPYNHIVNRFQNHFVDVARLYYKRTGKRLQFVPLYISPKRRTMYFGRPICYSEECSAEQQREEIADYLMKEITSIAVALPHHQVVPYANVSKKNYPNNTDEVKCHENTDC